MTIKTNIEELNSKDNLAVKAARQYMKHYRLTDGLTIEIDKVIPLGGGLGGGSSNAAAVFRALDILYSRKTPKRLLYRWCNALGSDVSFFIDGRTQIGRDRGTCLTKLRAKTPLWFVLINPGFHMSTKEAYDRINITLFNSGKPYYHHMVRALANGTIDCLGKTLYNIFEFDALERYPKLKRIKADLLREGAVAALLSGSGATVFGLFRSQETAIAASKALSMHYPWVRSCKSYDSN